jgi:heme/copper-type cytochrome/quinol oxidase subunit 3
MKKGNTMAPEATETMIDEVGEIGTLTAAPPPFHPEPPDGPDDGGPHGDDEGSSSSPISNARLGMIMLLGAETMLFAGLIGSFLVFRLAHASWPPPTLPRLPIVVTGINTLFLLYSALTMWQAQQSIRAGWQQRGVRMLLATALLGVTFLAIQGYEWVKLIDFGLTLTSGVYGATFYTLIGCHGVHVLGAVVWLLSVLIRAMQGRYSPARYVGVAVCGMYWHYVVALWPILYVLVYLY